MFEVGAQPIFGFRRDLMARVVLLILQLHLDYVRTVWLLQLLIRCLSVLRMRITSEGTWIRRRNAISRDFIFCLLLLKRTEAGWRSGQDALLPSLRNLVQHGVEKSWKWSR